MKGVLILIGFDFGYALLHKKFALLSVSPFDFNYSPSIADGFSTLNGSPNNHSFDNPTFCNPQRFNLYDQTHDNNAVIGGGFPSLHNFWAGYDTERGCMNLNKLGNRFNVNNGMTNQHWLNNLKGRVVLLAKNQSGRRDLISIMKRLKVTSNETSFIFLELLDHVAELMVEPFVNYVVQKLVEICTEFVSTHMEPGLWRNC